MGQTETNGCLTKLVIPITDIIQLLITQFAIKMLQLVTSRPLDTIRFTHRAAPYLVNARGNPCGAQSHTYFAFTHSQRGF